MNSQIMLGLFASLALVVVFLIIVVSVKAHRTTAYQQALLKTRQSSQTTRKDASKQGSIAPGVKSSTKEESKSSGASRDFKPSI